MTRTILRIFFFLFLVPLAFSQTGNTSTLSLTQRRVNFDRDWRFHRGAAPGAESPSADDSSWQIVRLPHDWAIEGPFDSKENPHTGALPIYGVGWYRKTFRLPENLNQQYFTIVFDGAMANSTVWINGHELGGRPYGYSTFYFDMTRHLHFGQEPNVLAVRLTPEDRSSRWYPGAGIYRNVWLDVTGPAQVAEWGTYVTTPKVDSDRAEVSVKTEVLNRLARNADVELRTTVLDADGKAIISTKNSSAIAPTGSQAVASTMTVPNPHLWDVDDPYLYTLVSELIVENRIVDRYNTTFGIRTISFDHQKGFFLNGRYRKLHGVCLHHDLGALGAAVNRRATERQLQIMKAGGVNAVRTSHNPPSPELLEYADRLGLLVMDEIFDMWRIAKVPNGYSKYYDEWSERDLRDMVRRDRNHPSIILWSIGNEIPEQGSAEGWKEAQRLTDLFHAEDPTRPTTSAFNEWRDAIRNHMAEHVDIPGFNYQPTHYEEIMKAHPGWTIFGSETASCVSSRGIYHLPLKKYQKDPSRQLSSYDIIAPPWAYCPDVEFEYQDRFPNILGEFVWTGFDYIGEPTPFFDTEKDSAGDWPARSSYFGMVDLAGFPKDRYFLYQSQWTTNPMVHILPHWNWQGREGQAIPVMAYTNADEVEIFLNGKSLGRKKRSAEPFEIPVGKNTSANLKFTTKYRLLWQVPYAPGTLRAVAYSGGKEVATEETRTAGAPAKIVLSPDRSAIQADGEDLSFVTVRIEDKDGNLCPMADNLVQFSVTGPGDIAGVDNGNAATVEPFRADHRTAFSGMALLIVRSRESAGKIHIEATANGLAKASVDVISQSVAEIGGLGIQ